MTTRTIHSRLGREIEAVVSEEASDYSGVVGQPPCPFLLLSSPSSHSLRDIHVVDTSSTSTLGFGREHLISMDDLLA
jgi:hypothetical protein